MSLDTLKLSKGLQRAGFTPGQAEEVAEALRESETDLVSRDFLKSQLSELKGELQRFVFVTFVLVAIVQILVVKFWH